MYDATPDGLAGEAVAAGHLGVKPSTLARWRGESRPGHRVGPPWEKVGGRVRYRVCDIAAWQTDQEREKAEGAARAKAALACADKDACAYDAEFCRWWRATGKHIRHGARMVAQAAWAEAKRGG